MANQTPYRATPDELSAVDEGSSGGVIPEAELPAYYRREAERLRREADMAETVEMRIVLLDNAQRLDKLAESFESGSVVTRDGRTQV